jgi:zinc transport system permease protein
MDIIEIMSHGFMQRALIAGSFVALSCSTLGLFLVLRRLSLIGDGLAHVTFGSVAVGLLLRVYPLYVAIPIVLAGSLGIVKLTERTGIYGDAAIGVVSSAGIAIGIILASVAGGFNVDLFSYLFGNILSITEGEVVTALLLSVLSVAVICIYYRDLLFITFNEELAAASGVKTKRVNSILVLLTALTVVLAMRVVGVMLISALLILPPVTALQMARGFKSAMIVSGVTGLLSVVTGVFASFVTDLPTGATIVIVNLLFFAAATVYKGSRQKA